MKFPIGIMADGLRLPLREGLQKAMELGAQGVQLYATKGEMAPENLDCFARRELREHIHGLGLCVSALCADYGGHGFAKEEDNGWKIEKSKDVMKLALALDCHVVTTHIGVVPEDRSDPRYDIMARACRELGLFGQELGCKFAIETGPEKAKTLRAFLEDLGCRGMCVNLDPANLTMVAGDDPVQAVYTLAPYIVHTHAKDGRMTKYRDPEKVYGFFAEGGIEDFRLEDYFIETPLGEGDVDWDNYLKALHEIDYCGFLTIEREVGPDPVGDIAKAVSFLKSKF